jgi:hypothetical protein
MEAFGTATNHSFIVGYCDTQVLGGVRFLQAHFEATFY